VQSVNRALDILECFGQEKSEWGLSELSQKLNLAPSTIHRLLNTLIKRGYIEQDVKLGKYKIGNNFLMLSGSVLNKCSLRIIAKPLLEELSRKTEETVHLCILSSNNQVFYLDKIESPKSISIISRIGQTLPPHVSGVGKVLLAHLSDEQLEKVLGQLELKRFTKNSITDKDQLKSELLKIRQQGYALDNQELEEGLICIASPIFNLEGKVIAAISISGPTFRLNSKIKEYIPLVKRTAISISELMGYHKS